MKRWLFFFVVLAVLFAASFALSIWLFPNWLAQPGWFFQLSGIIILAGLSVFGTEILSKSLSFLFEDKDLNERLSFVFGNKYQNISKRLDEFTLLEIGKEKKSRKYIPNIFVETTEIKEKLRYFSEPLLFFSKIVEQTDRGLRGAYIVNALKQVHYPVGEFNFPSQYFTFSKNQPLAKPIQEYRKYLGEKSTLMDILFKKDGAGIKPEYKSRIPSEYAHIHNYIYPYLQFYWSYEDAIQQAKGDLDLLVKKLVIVKSMAGHGKTNLLCDFVENFLVKKEHKCLYLSARALNHLGEQETIEEAITRIIFAKSDFQFADIVRLTKFDKKIDFLFILIDGINEHKDLPLFSLALEQFVQRCSGHNIKIILTCRSEYFDDRFGNLSKIEDCLVLDMDNGRSRKDAPDPHTEYLLSRYFSEFKVDLLVDNVGDEVLEAFAKDKLLLRIFCEAYENEKPAERLDNLYKLEVFYKYYEKKSESIHGLDKCLEEIVTKMIATGQFANIQISDLSKESIEIIEKTTYENVILKKDIFIRPDLAFGKADVINFVYDEFRDFLIASHVIKEWKPSLQSSIDTVQALTANKSTVAEGVQRYLCLWSIKNKEDDLLNRLSSLDRFDQIFIDSVFDVPDNQVSSFAINLIRALFEVNSTNTLRVIWRLIRRTNTEIFPNLNVGLFFSFLDGFNKDKYAKIIVAALNEDVNYESTHIAHLCTLIVEAFREKRISKISQKNVVKILAYLAGVEDYKFYRTRNSELGEHPAYEALSIISEEINEELVQAAIGEVIASCTADIIKRPLISLKK